MFRTVHSVINVIFHHNTLLSHRRCLTNLTSAKSVQDTASASKDNNEWLWDYLRHRQTFQSLNDEQKRQVITLE